MIQILYPASKDKGIDARFLEEACLMEKVGFSINTTIHDKSKLVLVRGCSLRKKENYPNNDKIINRWENSAKTLYMDKFYPIIEKKSIPTVFIDKIETDIIKKICVEKNWNRVFIKYLTRSLFTFGPTASVWPDNSIQEIKFLYDKWGLFGPFAIRKFIDEPEIFYNEQRYWILNGNAYHPSGEIPDFVKEYGKKMYEFSGSHYFSMDVAGDYIVEINPGENSDRGGDNPLEWFCEIFAKEFLHK